MKLTKLKVKNILGIEDIITRVGNGELEVQ